MKSIDFFNKLIDRCKYIPESKLEKIISYYRNEINTGLSHGQTEEEIVNNFGDIDKIIYDINTETELFINTQLNTSITQNVIKKNIVENNINKKTNNIPKITNIIFKLIFFILILGIIIPVSTTIIGFVFGILALFLVALVFSIYVLFNLCILQSVPSIPIFLSYFPSNSLIFFSLSLICLSAFFIIFIFYIIKSIILYLIDLYKSEKHMGGSI